MTDQETVHVHRRTLLMGSAGLMFLSACGGGSDGTKIVPTAKQDDGPVINEQDAGNAVTPKDVAVLVAALNAAFEGRDLDRLLELVGATTVTPGDKDLRERWAYRLDNFERNDIVSGEFFVGLPEGRARNSSGGPLEYRSNVVFGHRIRDCDSRDVVEVFDATFVKDSATAPLVIDRVSETPEGFAPAIWDVAKVDIAVTDHAVLAFRSQDRDVVRRSVTEFDAGVARAFDLMPRPAGVEKVFIAVAWDEVRDTLWGGSNLIEAQGVAYSHLYVDPAELAQGQTVAVVGDGQPVATARIAVNPSAFESGSVGDVACHEAVHALANQWGRDAPRWVVEGLARWVENQADAGAFQQQRDAIARSFPGFRRRMPRSAVEEFYTDDPDGLNYECGAAVFEHLARTEGRERVIEVASTFYGNDDADTVASVLGVDEDGLFAATQKWLRA
ncbi:hypothetical protein [Aeromicrobium fastidiosum]|uniref:Peptidase MA-like domain-containing protein n=1 Tax=Aeromicrobium fastidiosum TaxID=52699 RepID=A0A641AR21_9ACTN|nr:hypothetical protein [Aeromicrobium fastidiosum]KAA1378695.1 hypothetical protein ESP62_010185 [Aeromicrobium fastidiosum]MBP2392318.1 hypothetical protein [Aeromicrobium fastidiosum]